MTPLPSAPTLFAPTSASWLNVAERFFGDPSEKVLRHTAFSSVEDPVAAIHACLETHNYDPRPFVLTARTFDILDMVSRARATLNQITSV